MNIQVWSNERRIVREVKEFHANFDCQQSVSGVILGIEHEYDSSGELEIFIKVA